MAGSVQTGADIMNNAGYHDNSAFNFQLKNSNRAGTDVHLKEATQKDTK